MGQNGELVGLDRFAAWAGHDERKWNLLLGVACVHPALGHAHVTRCGMRWGSRNITIKLSMGKDRLLAADTGIWDLELSRSALVPALRQAGYRIKDDAPQTQAIRGGAKMRKEPADWVRTEITARKITLLCHFTPLANVAGILRHGLLPQGLRGDVDPKPLLCDDKRLDRHPEASSLSISFPNYKLLTAYRDRYEERSWAVLLLSPEILSTNTCGYYFTNAARGSFDHLNPDLYQTREAFVGLFAPSVETGNRSASLAACCPTDPQAEVLVFGTIHPAFIGSIHVQTSAGAAQLERQRLSVPVVISDYYFGPRTDYMSWPSPPRPDRTLRHFSSRAEGLEEEVPF